jgi:ABC-type transport system involved in multi-copper enzyme maturation permease subunit
MKQVTKQGQVGNIQGFILSIVGVAVVLAVGLIVLAELQGSTITTGSSGIINSTSYCSGAGGAWNGSTCTTGTVATLPESYTSTGTVITKLGTVPTWIGILIVVALAFIVLSFFGGRR